MNTETEAAVDTITEVDVFASGLPNQTFQASEKLWIAWALGDTILTLIIIVATALLSYFQADKSWLWVAQIVLIPSIVLLIINILLQPMAARRVSLKIEKDALLLKQGLIIQREVLLPLNRIQHIDTSQGPIERQLDLASLKLATAAGEVRIPGLTNGTANMLRDQLLSYLRVNTLDV